MENNGKYEELFNLALQMSPGVRERSPFLSAGYRSRTAMWEVVAKYNGDVERIREKGIEVEELIAGYSILQVPENRIQELGTIEEIEFVELPKGYYAQEILPREAVNANRVISREPYLSGKGVLIAMLDSGADYRRREFRNRDGSTRILYYWDQTQVEGIYTEEEINQLLLSEQAEDVRQPKPDRSGHGTAVLGIAAGYDYEGQYSGIAQSASLLVVALGNPNSGNQAPYSTDIMRGVKFALEKAWELRMPLIVNLSYGNTYGPHNGSALLERYLDNAAEIGRTAIFVGAGNEAATAGHYRGILKLGKQLGIAFSVSGYEQDLSLQLWKYAGDLVKIDLIAPSGKSITLTREYFGDGGRVVFENCNLICYLGGSQPYRSVQEIYIELQSLGEMIPEGIWQLLLTGERIQNGRVDAYLQNSSVRGRNTAFVNPNPNLTLTSPSTATKVITVGAYDSVTEAYADFSGRGEEGNMVENVLENGVLKPDFVAPGVELLAPFREQGYTAVTGTSFSTPLAAGCGALLMEWGIVQKNAPFLYGEKLKAKLRASTIRLRNMEERPDNKNGYGGLTIFDDFVENI